MTRRKQKKMRRTHGLDQGANVPLNSVDAYLDSIAIGEPQPYDQFRQLLLDRFPQLAKQFLPILGERSRDSEETMGSPYVVKNRDLDFSLTIASQFTGSQYRAYLRWFSETVDVKPRTIVDVGCDNCLSPCVIDQSKRLSKSARSRYGAGLSCQDETADHDHTNPKNDPDLPARR